MPTAIVTGCFGAIGRAICGELAEAGFDLVGLDRTEGATFDLGRYYACDLADADAVAAVLTEMRAQVRDVGVLVNNAGYYDPKGFFDLTVEDFDKAMAINVRAIFQLSQGVAQWMIDDGVTGGSIVNIASIAGKIGSPIIPYGTSKAAVIGLTRSSAKALAKHGIRVNAVAPGVTKSPMSDAINEAQMKVQMAQIAMARLAEPKEMACVVRFLASPQSSYMTGSIVDVNGGWMA